jgi:hypothetical protein
MCYVVLTKSVALMTCLQMIYYLPPAGCENINILVIILNSVVQTEIASRSQSLASLSWSIIIVYRFQYVRRLCSLLRLKHDAGEAFGDADPLDRFQQT